jgi:hypothetical protein
MVTGGCRSKGAFVGRQSREKAHADVVGGLLDARNDLATERFDAELAAAEAGGRVDPQTARVLKWWQRESMRALVEHARTVVPPALTALEDAASEAERGVQTAARSWGRASGDLDGELDARPAQVAADGTFVPPADLSAHRRRLLIAGLTTVRKD